MKSTSTQKPDTPFLVQRTGAALASIAGRIKADPDITKTLRTMALSARPIAYWRLAQELPDGGTLASDVILRGLGSIAHATGNGTGSWTPGFGAILARCDFPESRVDRLLASSGDTLRGLAEEVVRFAVAKGVAVADWRSLAGMLIADALDDDEAVEWCRRQVAREYVRVPQASAKAA